MTRRILAGLVVPALLLSACSAAEEPAEDEPADSAAEPEVEPEPEPEPEPPPRPEDRFPLTGEATEDAGLDRPVVAVKIDNAPRARPQLGLEAADVVFEEIVEGGTTRFNALFHSEIPEVIGPVRSGRLVDAPLLDPFTPVLLFSGGRSDVLAALEAARIGMLADVGLGNSGGSARGYYRLGDRPAPNNLAVNTETALANDVPGAGPVPELPWAFADTVPTGGADQPTFSIRMSARNSTGWEWDAEASFFRRSQNGSPTQVMGDGRIGAANVVLVMTDVGEGGCCDTSGSPYVETRVNGGGDAIVWRDGQRFELTWEKDTDSDPYTFLDATGAPFEFAPGPTWIHLTTASGAPAAP